MHVSNVIVWIIWQFGQTDSPARSLLLTHTAMPHLTIPWPGEGKPLLYNTCGKSSRDVFLTPGCPVEDLMMFPSLVLPASESVLPAALTAALQGDAMQCLCLSAFGGKSRIEQSPYCRRLSEGLLHPLLSASWLHTVPDTGKCHPSTGKDWRNKNV